MTEARPFYHRYAAAYELLQPEPVDARVGAIAALLDKRKVPPPARVLDAGCGTGRYAAGLADHGYHVVGVDRSPDLVAIARGKGCVGTGTLDFAIDDLTTMEGRGQFDAILCRGVLNDILEDDDRERLSWRFARLLRLGGALLLDVRDWSKTVRRYESRTPLTRVVALPNEGELSFQSETTLGRDAHQMRVRETFELRRTGSKEVERTTTAFRMRCWSEQELSQHFGGAFEEIQTQPDYVAPPIWVDRIVFSGKRTRS